MSMIEVSISPYVPLSPDLSAAMPVNGYFSIRFHYGGERTEEPSFSEEADGQGMAYQSPTVTLSGFVKEKGDCSAVFNTSDEFAAFVDSLQFDDTSMYQGWTVEKPDERNLLRIVKKSPAPLKEDFVCSLHSLTWNPTNPKGDDGRAVLNVTAENFAAGTSEEYRIYASKVYVSDILSFQADKTNVKIGENFTLSWNCRGDFVDAAQLQQNLEKPKTVGVSGNETVSISCPSVFQLMVQNKNPGALFRATAYVSIDLAPPGIEAFTADRTCVYNKENVTLNWKANSAYACQLNGEGDPLAPSGSLVVTPDFTQSEHKKSMEYMITAFGYQGQKPYSAHRKLEIARTFWEEAGTITGVSLSNLSKSQPQGIFFDGSKSYLFDGAAVCESEDGIAYQKVSALSMEEGVTLHENYKTGYDRRNHTFYIVGPHSGEDQFIAGYDTVQKKWATEWASETGDKFLNGCFVPDEDNSRLYYLFYFGNRAYIYQRNEDGWGLTGQSIFDKEITACDCLCWRDYMRLGLLFQDHVIRMYDINSQFDKVIKSSVVSSGETKLSLAATDNDLLILGERAVYDARDGRKVDNCPDGRLLSGCGDEPVMVCRIDGTEKLFRLHTKEM